MPSVILYGLPNCDTTRAAMKWLGQWEIDFVFRDYRENPVGRQKLEYWISIAGIEKVLNKKSKTWRELAGSSTLNDSDRSEVISLLENYPVLIKRPVLEINGTILTGFREDEYLSLIKPG